MPRTDRDAIPYDRRLAQHIIEAAAAKTGHRIRPIGAVGDRLAMAAAIAMVAEARLGKITRDWPAPEGRRPRASELAGWSADMRRVVASAHMAAARVSLGRAPTDADRERLDRLVKEQLRYLDKFAAGLKNGSRPTGPRMVADARLYGAACWSTAEAIRKGAAIDGGATHERAFLGVAEHCKGCVDRAERGWVPIGTLEPIGSMECRVRCACYFLYRVGDSPFEADSPEGAAAAYEAMVPPDVDASPAPAGKRGGPFVDTAIGEFVKDAAADPMLVANEDRLRDMARRMVELESRAKALVADASADHSQTLAAIAAEHRSIAESRTAIKVASADRFAAMLDAAIPARPLEWTFKAGGGFSRPMRDVTDVGVRLLRTLFKGRGSPEIEIHEIAAKDRPRSRNNEMYTSPKFGFTVFLHEASHVLEHQLPGVNAACRAFLAKRVGDEPFTPLSKVFPACGYMPSEKGRRDRFEAAFGKNAWYVGKEPYSNGSTEILTMGLEYLFQAPSRFLKADPEFAAFLIKAMRGGFAP